MEPLKSPAALTAPPPPSSPPAVNVAGSSGNIDVRVGRRLVWVGNAAYPMRNITRVHTYTIRPKRHEAVLQFVTRVAVTAAVAVTLTLLATLPAALVSAMGGGDSGFGIITFVWLAGFGLGVYYFVRMITVATAPACFVLAIETSGPPTALITSSNPRLLPQLAEHLVRAMENPETEFQVTVETVAINPRNYHFGDSINMYGGTGNVGVAS
ncbi:MULTISPECIES: DUF6232 family protein [unclassified Streptomyces]|uniref:DUF6232 family protein n=1 Tax=unclassified Streptomyces TaxID=2593676 RepID=UPI000DAC2D3E|nr:MULTISPECIES: DUF6232 family protein [unclassified Streptomyces]PZT77378.1 hypothetical protein DNK56_29735 [Streptomyces sp. AC1-42W]PZT78667.1 hypothetical protein DNK55_02945 [Streptomyces sp. AC1-42T]